MGPRLNAECSKLISTMPGAAHNAQRLRARKRAAASSLPNELVAASRATRRLATINSSEEPAKADHRLSSTSPRRRLIRKAVHSGQLETQPPIEEESSYEFTQPHDDKISTADSDEKECVQTPSPPRNQTSSDDESQDDEPVRKRRRIIPVSEQTGSKMQRRKQRDREAQARWAQHWRDLHYWRNKAHADTAWTTLKPRWEPCQIPELADSIVPADSESETLWPAEADKKLIRVFNECGGANLWTSVIYNLCFRDKETAKNTSRPPKNRANDIPAVLEPYSLAEIIDHGVALRDEYVTYCAENGLAEPPWIQNVWDPRLWRSFCVDENGRMLGYVRPVVKPAAVGNNVATEPPSAKVDGREGRNANGPTISRTGEPESQPEIAESIHSDG